jgi:SAM-dependent methyltransferase
MRDWALGLLQCLECASRALEVDASAIRCLTCGHVYPQRDGVVDFLHTPHPVVARERAAVHRIDQERGAPRHWMDAMLQRAVRGEFSAEDLASSANVRAIAEARPQILSLLEQEHAIVSGATVLELGADTGWSSPLLLQFGCRVIATDITDHLYLAPAAASPDLCRLLADMNRIPLADKTVDVVFAAACVHHSWDLKRTFAEIARVLKPGGVAYLCGEPMPSLVRFAFGWRVGDWERSQGINETWIPRGTWLRVCRSAGLQPRVVIPELTDDQLRERLRSKGLPQFIGSLLRPVAAVLQVSAHLRAEKREVSER